MKVLALTLSIIMALLPSQENRMARLWSQYEKHDSADRPADKLATLEKIKELALETGSAWDYYDACVKYRDTRCSMNWKLRSEASDTLDREVERYGSPVMLFAHKYAGSEEAFAFVESRKQELLSAHNPRFYENDNMVHRLLAGKPLAALIANDYEYCLWSLYSDGNEEAEGLLAERVRGRYPFEAILSLNETRELETEEKKKTALDSIEKEYDGKVMALYAKAELLQARFDELVISKPESDEGYRIIDNECSNLISKTRIASRSRDKAEKTLAAALSSPSGLSKTLNEKDVIVRVQDDTLLVMMRNLKEATVMICKDMFGERLHEKELHNTKCSFYMRDTLEVPLAFLEDGDYSIEALGSDCHGNAFYEKRSLSLALRANSEDTGVYVCDFMTGEPCGELTIVLKDSGKQRAACTLPAGEGFRALPGEIMSKIRPESWTHTVQASLTDAEGKLRLSPDIRVNAHEEYVADTDVAPMLQAAVLLDRSAFNPGETMHFKAVLYNDFTYRHECAGAGLAVKAELLDTEGKNLSSKKLTTNEFGSVAGDFDLPADGRGGLYTLRISSGSKVLSARRVRVDEFNLPAFRLDWDKDNRMLLGGDKAVVSGCLSSYSGHEMRVAHAEYSVSLYGKILESGALDVARDGSFRFGFSTDEDYRYGRNYIIKVTVREESGEMLSFEKVVNVLGYLPFSLEVRNNDEGMFWLDGMNEVKAIVSEDTLSLNFNSYAYSALDLRPEQRVSYRLLDSEGNEVLGSETGEDRVRTDISGLADGIYTLTCEASAIADNGKKYSAKEEMTVMVLRPDCKAVSAPVAGMFRYTGSAGKPALQIASGMGGLWAVVELYGNGNVLLDSRCVYLEGRSGEESSLCSVEFDAPDGYSQYELNALSFKDGSEMSWSHRIDVPKAPEEKIELSLNRFTNEAVPGSTVSIEAVGAAGMECAATVFDLSSERIMGNYWDSVRTRPIIYPSVYYSTSCGSHGSSFRHYGLARNMMLSNAPKATDTAVMYEMEIEEDAVSVGAMEESGAAAEEPVVREEFGATLAWEPFLQSDEEGRIGFSFRAGDKLSTYVVQLFAHDKDFGNAVLRENMVVTMPVAIQLSEPAFLYSGDRYSARVVLSSCSDEDVKGSLSVKFIDGSSYDDGSKVLASKTKRVKVEAREAIVADFDIDVPEIGELGILVSFKATKGDFSDAVFVTVPVKRPAQSITEAHSALLLDGALREEMLDSLRRSFVNFDGAGAAVSERSIMELLLSELPGRFEPRSENVLDLLEALYADCLDRRIRESSGFARFAARAASSECLSESERDEIVAKILACRNADGGFGWLSGLPSSARITAVLLEWCADMGEDCDTRLRALLPDALDYLDKGFFRAPGVGVFRFGWLNVAEYLHVRSLYPGHAVKCKVGDTKAITEYLEDTESAKLDILSKARRIRTIEALAAAGKNCAFASSLGINVGSKLRKAAAVDTESLLQYAQPHGSGGTYYPNAVMPLRGLLESELYAHVMLCELLDDCGRSDLAEGIRLWIMVQKESQKWEGDFAYLRALSAVTGGSEATLGAKVIALSVTSPLRYEDIKPAGNGMSVSVSYSVAGKPVEEGQMLKPGDVLKAEYKVWNAENRSFVRLTVPCSAALRNVRELSGPFYVNWSACYRDVKADRVEYWFTTLAEETSTITEEYYVTQAGRFCSAAPTVESFYAPHYRANGTSAVTLSTRED